MVSMISREFVHHNSANCIIITFILPLVANGPFFLSVTRRSRIQAYFRPVGETTNGFLLEIINYKKEIYIW